MNTNNNRKDTDITDIMDVFRHGKKIFAVSIVLTVLATVFVTKVVMRPVYSAESSILIKEEKLDSKEDFPTYESGEKYAYTQAEIMTSKDTIKRALARVDFKAEVYSGIDQESLKIDELQENIRTCLLKDTDVLKVTLEHENRFFAADLLNKIIETYIQDKVDQKVETVKTIAGSLEREAKNAKNSFTDIEDALSKIASEQGVIMLSGSEMVLDLKKFADLDAQMTELNSEIEMLTSQIENMEQWKNSNGANSEDLKFIANSMVLQNLKSEIRQAEVKLDVLKGTYHPNHPDVKVTVAAIEALKDNFKQEKSNIVNGEIRALNMQKKALIEKKQVMSAAYDSQTNRIDNSIKAQPELARLNREVEMRRQIYSSLMEKLEQVKVLEQRAALTADAKVIEYAEIPEDPVSPSLIKNIFLGLILAIIIGFALSLITLGSSGNNDDGIYHDERRHSTRYKSFNMVKCSSNGAKKENICWTKDVSSKGMQIISSKKMDKDNQVSFEVQRDKMKPIVGKGTIAWTAPVEINDTKKYAVGIEFNGLKLDIDNKQS